MAMMGLSKVVLGMLMMWGIPSGESFLGQEVVPESDKLNHEAITTIHSHLDDDRNGKVDFSESTEFMRDELHVTDEERHSHFHGNDDYISVDELWEVWVQSAVHNWTNKDVVDWLVNSVHLPQYAEIFTSSTINGSVIPRLATEDNGLLQNELGVKDPKHRKKISLRAMDIVLFGPPFVSGHNLIKDVVVAFSVLVATVGCWVAVLQKRKAKEQMERMIKDMKILQQAEDGLQQLQTRLSKAEMDHQVAVLEKCDLETRLKEELLMSQTEAQMLTETRTGSEEKMQRLRHAEEELAQVRRALKKAEKELEYQAWRAPSVLKQWLQMTFERETKHFQQKRTIALKQMEEAKEACERIKKKRNSLIGSLRLAHDLSIDEVDQKILSARTALAEVTNELEERQHRWSQIESLCGFQIMSQSSFGVGKGGARPRTSSAIAQALFNVANVAGVSSGRKISSSAQPWIPVHVSEENTVQHEDKDLPPTYSTATAHLPVNNSSDKESPKHAISDVQDVIQESCSEEEVLSASTCIGNNCHNPVCSDTETEDSQLPGTDAASKIEPVNSGNTAKRLSLSLGQALDVEPAINGATSESPTGKSKKRLSWFGKKQDSFSESESSTTENDEENKKKIKWLWKSAVRKTKTQKNPPSKPDSANATSVEKLKSG